MLQAYRGLIRQAGAQVRERLRQDLATVDPLLDQVPASPLLKRARQELRATMAEETETG